jgi:chlorite dismutase
MRFDEASAKFAEFGPFYVGMQFSVSELGKFLEGELPELVADNGLAAAARRHGDAT